MEKIISIEEYIESLKKRIRYILKDSTYVEVCRYIERLPNSFFERRDEKGLFYWGKSYINEYFKIMGKLDNDNNDELKYKIYTLYLAEEYISTYFSYEEFITFSRLLNATFSDYDPNRIRKSDKEKFEYSNQEIADIVNRVIKDCVHSPHPNAYEISKFKLDILLDELDTKKKELQKNELAKIDLEDEEIKNILSENRIKELIKKIKH